MRGACELFAFDEGAVAGRDAWTVEGLFGVWSFGFAAPSEGFGFDVVGEDTVGFSGLFVLGFAVHLDLFVGFGSGVE